MELLRKIMAALLVTLLLTRDYTLMVNEVVFHRNAAWWSPWLYKTGLLTVADIIIISITAFTLICIVMRMSIPRSAYLKICGLTFAYLIIGFIYNISVYTLWKTYLYDFKVFLCLTVPYLFLHNSLGSNVLKMFSIKLIFFYVIIAGTIDLLVSWVYFVYSLGISIPYPQFLGFPIVVPLILPAHVAMVGVLFADKMKYKIIFLFLALFNVISAINTLSFGYLSIIPMYIPFLFVLFSRISLPAKAGFIFAIIVIANLTLVTLITNPLKLNILDQKSDGAITRIIQLDNALLNSKENIPGLIGKGWGSTWFEYIPIPENDVYSVGTSVAAEQEEAMALPVKFIFNWMPPALMHKWGILGMILLSFFVTNFYEILVKKIRKLKRLGLCKRSRRYLYAISIIAFFYVMSDFMWSTSLTGSVFSSILAFCVEREIDTYAKKSYAYRN